MAKYKYITTIQHHYNLYIKKAGYKLNEMSEVEREFSIRGFVAGFSQGLLESGRLAGESQKTGNTKKGLYGKAITEWEVEFRNFWMKRLSK